MTPSRFSLCLGIAMLLGGVGAQAAPNDARAQCANVPEASRAACIREAGAAAQAARAGQLTSDSAADYERNALARCEVFKAAQDQADCRARMGPKAVLSGSVDGGGILREQTDTWTVKE